MGWTSLTSSTASRRWPTPARGWVPEGARPFDDFFGPAAPGNVSSLSTPHPCSTDGDSSRARVAPQVRADPLASGGRWIMGSTPPYRRGDPRCSSRAETDWSSHGVRSGIPALVPRTGGSNTVH